MVNNNNAFVPTESKFNVGLKYDEELIKRLTIFADAYYNRDVVAMASALQSYYLLARIKIPESERDRFDQIEWDYLEEGINRNDQFNVLTTKKDLKKVMRNMVFEINAMLGKNGLFDPKKDDFEL